MSDSSGKILGVNIKDCNGFYIHTTDIGFVGIDVDSSSVMVEGYKAGTMVVSLFKSDETNGTLSTVVIRVGGSTCSVAITTPSGTSTNPGGTGNQGGEFDYNSVAFKANMDIRNEIVRLTNEVRKETGVSELPTDSAVMNAAQAAAEEVTLPDAVATARLLMAQGTPPAAAAKQAAKGTPFSKGDIYKELIAAKDEDDREEESE